MWTERDPGDEEAELLAARDADRQLEADFPADEEVELLAGPHGEHVALPTATAAASTAVIPEAVQPEVRAVPSSPRPIHRRRASKPLAVRDPGDEEAELLAARDADRQLEVEFPGDEEVELLAASHGEHVALPTATAAASTRVVPEAAQPEVRAMPSSQGPVKAERAPSLRRPGTGREGGSSKLASNGSHSRGDRRWRGREYSQIR